MKKIIISSVLLVNVYAIEFEYGMGTFGIDGGFVGLNSKKTADVTTYSLIEQHQNLFGSTWFYKYNLTWYDSNDATNTQQNINNQLITPIATPITPSIDYKLQGLDVNLALGKDLSHKSENQYLGIGLMLGISLPWIESKKNKNNDDTTSNAIMNNMEDSKTKIKTYKIGPTIHARTSLSNLFTLYAGATYAYQKGKIKNDYAHSNLSVKGTFQEYDFGIRFQPISYDKKFGFITLSPRFYMTLGYRYSNGN